MSVILKPKRTSTPSAVPTTSDLADGELGVNTADGKMWVREGGLIKQVGSSAEGTVTSVDILGEGPITFSGGPITSSGDIYLHWDGASADTVLKANGFGVPPSFQSLSSADIISGVFSTARIPYSPDFISGCTITTTDTTVSVSEGEVYIPNIATIVSFTGGTISLSRAANTTYHLYVDNAGVLTRSTIAPGVPYFGTARSRGTSNGSRYIGSVSTDSSGNYYRMRSLPGSNLVHVDFLHNTNVDSVMITNGSSASAADVSAASWAPLTAVQLTIRVYQNNPSGSVRIYAYTGSGFVVWSNVPPANEIVTFSIPCDATPKFQYDVVGGGSLVAALLGYSYTR